MTTVCMARCCKTSASKKQVVTMDMDLNNRLTEDEQRQATDGFLELAADNRQLMFC